MARNVGKQFEDNFKKSVPNYALSYRPPDSAQGFDVGASNKLRFSRHSPCDLMVFDGTRNLFLTLELKTFQGSCSFERNKEEKGIIHYYQVEKLKEFANYKRVISGFVLDFRSADHTYFLNINDWDNLISHIEKKSFNEQDLLEYASPILIEKEKLKVNYRYDVELLLSELNI
jgi:recombination protein U|nr:MAG TPA: penicillin-binding protein-related factor A [Caudoviricetes sp.]